MINPNVIKVYHPSVEQSYHGPGRDTGHILSVKGIIWMQFFPLHAAFWNLKTFFFLKFVTLY